MSSLIRRRRSKRGQQIAPFDATLEDRFKYLQRARNVVGSLKRQVIGGNRDDQAVTGKHCIQRQHADVGAAVDDAGALRVLLVECIEADTQLVEDRRPFAENGVDLDQLLVSGNQGAEVFPGLGQFVETATILKEGEQAATSFEQNATMNAGQMPLRVKVDQ